MEEPKRTPVGSLFTVLLTTALGALGGWGASFWLSLRVRSKVPSFTGSRADALVLAGLLAGALAGLVVGLRSLSRTARGPRR